MKCTVVLRHSDWVWGLVPHDTTVVSTSGSNVYVWDTDSGNLVTIILLCSNMETQHSTIPFPTSAPLIIGYGLVDMICYFVGLHSLEWLLSEAL
jgi:hypothetical protein